ncbi:hypothetical protein ABPG73_018382 [Tetrahymena malaccensis]
MKKIQKKQELKQQQAKQKNMMMKQQVIEEMLNQTNQSQKQNQGTKINAFDGSKDSSNSLNSHDNQKGQEDQNDIEQDDLGDTLDYNKKNNNNNEQRNNLEHLSQNFKAEQKDQRNQQYIEQNEDNSKNSITQMYPVDSLNQLPPLKSQAQTNNMMIDKKNYSQRENNNRAQMVQSQNYVGEEDISNNYSKQNRESLLRNKASTNNGISDSIQKSKVDTQKKLSQMIGQANMQDQIQKSNLSNNYQSKVNNKMQNNSIQKTELVNNSGQNSKQFDKADAQSRVSQLNKSIRDQIFQDEIDYTESLQVDAQYPFLEKQNKSHLKNSQNKSFSVQESQERLNQAQNQNKQKKSSFINKKYKKNKYSSSPCIQQDDFDESDQEEELDQQKNNTNFDYQNNNNSKFSNESQNLNKNLSVASNSSQRFLKSSAQNERFPIFNKGSSLQVNQDQEDSETEGKKKSQKQSSYKQSDSEAEEIFENECKEDLGDNMPPKADKMFQTFKSNPIQLQGNFYNSNYNQDSNEEEEQIENQRGGEEEDFDCNQDNQFEQTEFEDIGNNYAAAQKSVNGVKDSFFKGKKQEDPDENQLKQLSDYSDQQEDAQNQSDEDKEELQDEAFLSTKLQGSKQKNDEPMIVSFGVQNQQSFGKQNSLNESQKQKQNMKKNSYEEDSLNENFQTFGARDSDKFLGMTVSHAKQQKSVELRKSQKPSQDFNETQKLPYCDQTAQFNDEVNPFKQLKQQMRQVKQNQQINQQDFQKNQEFDRKRQDILRDAESNIKKVMNDQIRMADSNKFKFSEQEESESPLNNQSQKSGISQNKSAQSRAQLIDNMRKKKDSRQEASSNSNQDKISSQAPSRPQFITQSNISDLKNNNQTFNNNNSDKMSTPDQQSYLKNSFDLKFQEAYEQQYDQSYNSQMVDGSPIQFVKNQNEIQQKYPDVNQERDCIVKKSQQTDPKSINVIHKPNYDEEEDFWQKQKQAENKKRKVWGNQKSSQQNQDKQYQNNSSDKLSQSIGQTSNIMSNQSNYHSKLQKLHESEEFQDNEFIELTLKQKIQDQNMQNSYEQTDNYRNDQPKLWETRNINAGGNRGGYKGYSQNGNQLEMEREEEDQEDYDQSEGYSQNYNNQYRNQYEDEEDSQQDDQNDETYSQNYQNNYYDQQQHYGQEDDDQEYDQSASNYNDNYKKAYEEKSYNQYGKKNQGYQNQRNAFDEKRYHHQEEEDNDESDNNNNYDNQDNDTEQNDDDKSDNFSPQKYDKSLNESNEENNLNQINKRTKQEEEEDEEEEEQKQIQKGVAMTIDFGDKDDDELEKKKKAFEIKRLKKIQELEQQKQKKQLELQQKQQLQVDDQSSGQKEKKYAHKKQPSQQIQQKQKAQQDSQPKSENNTPSNKQLLKKANDQFAKNQQNIFSVNQREQMLNQNSPKSKSPIRQQVKEKVKLPVINKKRENIEEENKSEIQENFTPKISVLENPTTKPRIPFSKPSNKQLISQAITKVCLAGPTNQKEREIALKKIKDSQQDHFIVLFKGINGRQDFKALYQMDSNTAEVKKIFGLNTAPQQIDLASVQAFYRYDSGSKEFKEILVKAFSNQVDAVLLKK